MPRLRDQSLASRASKPIPEPSLKYRQKMQTRERRGAPTIRKREVGEADTAWKDQAVCDDVDVMYAEGVVNQRIAKSFCARCPVVEDCLAYAMDTRQDFGVWGGLSEEDRRNLRRRNQRK